MLERLRKTLTLLWLKFTSLFKNNSMKSLSAQIENCLKYQILSTIPNATILSNTYQENGKVYQTNHIIEINNCCGFTLVINFRDINNIKYNMIDNNITDIDLQQSTMNVFAPNLNSNKCFIDGWVKQYVLSSR